VNGCQSGCTPTTTSLPPATATQEPVIGKPTNTSPSSGGGVTTDGSCGSANGNTVCGSWHFGNCCSMYGCGFSDFLALNLPSILTNV
jgi:hypothetical protein